MRPRFAVAPLARRSALASVIGAKAAAADVARRPPRRAVAARARRDRRAICRATSATKRAARAGRARRNAARTSAPTSNARGPDRRAEPRERGPRGAPTLLQRGDRRFEDAGGESAPARMRDADRAAAAVREEHGKAIGGQHRADDAALARDGGVGDGRSRRAVAAIEDATVGAVHLIAARRGGDGQKRRRRRRFSATASADRRRMPRRDSSSRTRPCLRRRLRVVTSACDAGATGQSGTIQSSPAAAKLVRASGSRSSRHADGRPRAKRGEQCREIRRQRRLPRAVPRRSTGCTRARRAACSACRPNRNRACACRTRDRRPADGRATRDARESDACGRSRAGRRAASRRRSARRLRSACAPACRSATTAIVVRRVGWRPIGASTMPPRAMSPAASAMYSRFTLRAASCRTSVGLRGERLGDDEEPARVLVEAMDDARARDRGELRARGGGAHSAACPARLPAPGCTTRPGRLVDDDAARRPRRRSASAIASGASAVSRGIGRDRARRRARRRGPCCVATARDAVERHAARRRSTRAVGCASIAAARARAPRRSARRPRPAGSVSVRRIAGRPRRGRRARRCADGGTADGGHASVIIASVGCKPSCESNASACASSLRHAFAHLDGRRACPARARLVALALALVARGLRPAARGQGRDARAIRRAHLRAAHGAMAEGNYTRAVKLFETLESRYPYGRYAQQAILEVGVCELPGGRDRGGDRRVRPLHPHVSQSPERRLRVLPQGPRLFPRGPGHIRLRLRARPVGARAEGDARVVRGVQGARHQVSGQPLRGRRARPDALPRPMRSRSTR